jgi:hypothetical protein
MTVANQVDTLIKEATSPTNLVSQGVLPRQQIRNDTVISAGCDVQRMGKLAIKVCVTVMVCTTLSRRRYDRMNNYNGCTSYFILHDVSLSVDLHTPSR